MSRRRRFVLPTVDQCDGCGVCCMHMGYPAFLQPTPTQGAEERWTSLPADLKEQLVQYIAAYRAPPGGELDGPCFWLNLKTRRCLHHEHRPRVCRDFRIGSQGCRDWREAYRHK